jgi:hypothetical protein
MLPEKYRSHSPSLLISPAATPPPFKKFLKVYGLYSSENTRLFVKVIPVLEGESKVKSVLEFSFDWHRIIRILIPRKNMVERRNDKAPKISKSLP